MSQIEDNILKEARSSMEIERVVCENGIQIHIAGAEFPMKGMPSPEAVSAINTVKKTLLQTALLALQWRFSIYIGILMFLSPKATLRSISGFLAPILEKTTKHIWLKEHEQCPTTKEVIWILTFFTSKLKMNGKIVEPIAHIFEFDLAYRYRLQDIMSMTSKEKLLENPRKEIKRLMQIYKDRELKDTVKDRLSKVSLLLQLLLLHPIIKQAFIYSIQNADIEKLQLDKADNYWCAFREDYNFGGLTLDKRQQWLKDMEYKLPTITTI